MQITDHGLFQSLHFSLARAVIVEFFLHGFGQLGKGTAFMLRPQFVATPSEHIVFLAFAVCLSHDNTIQVEILECDNCTAMEA
jgi:hypothetical protein